MKKKDFYYSLIVGGIIAVFLLIFLSTLSHQIPSSYKYLYKYRWLFIFIFPFSGLSLIYITNKLQPKWPSFFQFSKFCLVGTSNTSIDLGILNLLMFATNYDTGIYFTIFKTISILFAIINSYLWNKFWTFESREYSFLLNQFFRFMIVIAVALVIDVGIATIFVSVYGDSEIVSSRIVANIGAILALAITTFWNFFGMKFFVFKKSNLSG